jgi:hypothetical protein
LLNQNAQQRDCALPNRQRLGAHEQVGSWPCWGHRGETTRRDTSPCSLAAYSEAFRNFFGTASRLPAVVSSSWCHYRCSGICHLEKPHAIHANRSASIPK